MYLEVLRLLVLNFDCIKSRLANFMGNPSYKGFDLRQYVCHSCSVCTGGFVTMYLAVRFVAVKKFLATEVAPKGKKSYTEVLDSL